MYICPFISRVEYRICFRYVRLHTLCLNNVLHFKNSINHELEYTSSCPCTWDFGVRQFSNCSNDFGNRRSVAFSYLPFNDNFVNNLTEFGIRSLKPFQYLMCRLLIDGLTNKQSSTSEKESMSFVFYNDSGSGKTIGYLLPLLYLYSLQHHDSVKSSGHLYKMSGSTLVICSSDSECSKVGSLLLTLMPSLKCIILQQHENASVFDDGNKYIPKNLNVHPNEKLLKSLLELNSINGENYNDIIVLSLSKLYFLLYSKINGFSTKVLSSISSIICDGMVPIVNNIDLYTHIVKLIENAKATECSNECAHFNTIFVTNTIDDDYITYVKGALDDFWLYDFKFGML